MTNEEVYKQQRLAQDFFLSLLDGNMALDAAFISQFVLF